MHKLPEKGEMPPMCLKNDLETGEIPVELKNLTNLEKQLIVKNLIFIKVRQLPKTRMDCINDRVINVPISDDNIAKRVTTLPRNDSNNGLVTVRLKRKLGMKNYHKHGFINPDRVYQALEWLVKKHPDYANIKIEDYNTWVKKCSFVDDNDADKKDEVLDKDISDDGETDSEQEGKNEKGDEKMEGKKKVAGDKPPFNDGEAESNMFNAHTCLCPEEPKSNMYVNHSDKKKKVRKSKKSEKVYEYAPGQYQLPTDWIREDNHDRVSFPELYPFGIGGLTSRKDPESDKPVRERPIRPHDFCSQRFCSHNRSFSKNADYLFVCQQRLERHLLENNINVFSQKGKLSKGSDGTLKLNTNNAWDMFAKIPGTPSYFKRFRNTNLAMVEQKGPFTMFITLSAAEMRWSDVSTALLRLKAEGIVTITYNDGWELDDNKIIVVVEKMEEGILKIVEEPLPLHMAAKKNKHKFYKDEFVLITKIFDNRVKAFLKHILMVNPDVDNYSYRIEFQVRGLPHLHGVFWLKPEVIEKYKTGKLKHFLID